MPKIEVTERVYPRDRQAPCTIRLHLPIHGLDARSIHLLIFTPNVLKGKDGYSEWVSVRCAACGGTFPWPYFARPNSATQQVEQSTRCPACEGDVRSIDGRRLLDARGKLALTTVDFMDNSGKHIRHCSRVLEDGREVVKQMTTKSLEWRRMQNGDIRLQPSVTRPTRAVREHKDRTGLRSKNAKKLSAKQDYS
jgi:hypothetical protein